MFSKIKNCYKTNATKLNSILVVLDYAILVLYGLFVFEAFMRTTTFTIDWHPYYHASLKVILILLVISKSLIKCIDNIPIYMVLGVCALGFATAYIKGNYGILLELILFTIALKDIDCRKLVTVFTTILGLSLATIMLASKLNVLNNIIYNTWDDGVLKQRISFGINYPTDFASYILFFCLAWTFLRRNKISYIEIALMYGLVYFVYRFCVARNSTICLFTFATLMLLVKIGRSVTKLAKGKKLLPNWMSCSFSYIARGLACLAVPVCAAFSISFSYYFTPEKEYMVKLNEWFSARLSIGRETFNSFSVKLFGQHIDMAGNGGYTLSHFNYSTNSKGYYFIDSSYLSTLIRYGLFVFVCVLIVFTLTSFMAAKRKDYVTLFIIAIIAVHSIIEHHMLDFNYNPFMFLWISSYFIKKKCDGSDTRELTDTSPENNQHITNSDLSEIDTSDKEVLAHE